MRTLALAAALTVSPAVARADDRTSFADEVKAATGNYHDAYIIQQLTSFKLGAKCWKKMHNSDENGIHTATFYVGYVQAYAKRATGDDWNGLETANNSDRDNNKAGVEKKVKEFSPKFSFELTNDGDDCDTTTGSLMLRYWTTVGDALQYLSAKKPVKIVLNVTSKAKDIAVKTTGNTIVITGPRDSEPKEWDQKIVKGFKQTKL